MSISYTRDVKEYIIYNKNAWTFRSFVSFLNELNKNLISRLHRNFSERQ